MTGGNVAYNASCAEPVELCGRVSSAGAKVAPATGAGKWVSAKTGTGVYTVTASETYAEFMGCAITLEAAGQFNYSYTAGVVTVNTFAADGTTATDKAFSFRALFTESKAF